MRRETVQLIRRRRPTLSIFRNPRHLAANALQIWPFGVIPDVKVGRRRNRPYVTGALLPNCERPAKTITVIRNSKQCNRYKRSNAAYEGPEKIIFRIAG